MAKLPVKHVVSAGGAVYRLGTEGLEVLLVGRSSLGTWGLPKGTPNDGESFEETAIREVGEETGLRVEIEAPLGNVRYWFTRVSEGFRFDKTVHFFLMRAVGGDISKHDWEHDQVRWFPLAEALRNITYRSEAEIIRRAGELAEQLPKQQVPGDRGDKENDAA